MQDLRDKAAIITGASRGIGAATARELARCGVAVVLAARNKTAIAALADEISESGGRAIARQCDVADYNDVASLVSSCTEAFGRLDYLVNNAGLIEPIALLADSSPDEWNQVVDVNLKGVYHGLRAAIPVMLEQGGGTVVNISSGAATSAMEGWSHYCCSKAAVPLSHQVR